MKKLLLIAAIASMAFVSCQDKGTGAAGNDSDSVQVYTASSQIAYINTDALVSRYDLYLDLRNAYETRARKVENELTAKGRSFERDVNDFQEKAQKGLITRSQAEKMEEDLQRKQQSFLEYRDKVVGELAEEEQVMLNRIHYSIVDFLKDFNSDYRYGMILSTTEAGPILNADPALDITEVILESLNKQYAEEKAAKK